MFVTNKFIQLLADYIPWTQEVHQGTPNAHAFPLDIRSMLPRECFNVVWKHFIPTKKPYQPQLSGEGMVNCFISCSGSNQLPMLVDDWISPRPLLSLPIQSGNWTLCCTLYCKLYCKLYCTLYCTLYFKLYFTLYNELRSTLYCTLYCTLYYTMYYTLYCTLYCTLYWTVYPTLYGKMYWTLYCILYWTQYSTLFFKL